MLKDKLRGIRECNSLKQKNRESFSKPNFKGVEIDPLLSEIGKNSFTMPQSRINAIITLLQHQKIAIQLFEILLQKAQ